MLLPQQFPCAVAVRLLGQEIVLPAPRPQSFHTRIRVQHQLGQYDYVI